MKVDKSESDLFQLNVHCTEYRIDIICIKKNNNKIFILKNKIFGKKILFHENY